MRWEIKFFPPSGEKHSPGDFIKTIANRTEATIIERRLETIRELELVDWPSAWVKKVAGIYQLKAGDHRVYFDLDGRTIIVVCHVCRKVSQRAKEKDIGRAKANLKSYYQGKESGQ